MIAIYVLYADIYLLEQCVWCLLLLVLTLIVQRRHVRVARLVLAAAAGGCINALPLLAGWPYGIRYLACLLAGSYAPLRVAAGSYRIGEGMLCEMLLSFALHKLYQAAGRLLGYGYAALALVILCVTAAAGYLCYNRVREARRSICEAQLVCNGQRFTLRALLDTGNALREPISGRPVSVVERKALEGIELREDNLRVIPFHSVGREHGILQGMEADTLTIDRDGEARTYSRVMIALCDNRLSTDGEYQMLLHQSFR